MCYKNLDLLLVLSFVALNVLVTLVPYKVPLLQLCVSLPLVFVLPGYVLSEVLFHKRAFDAAHRLTSSLALSIAIVIISGFILNVLPIGLQAISWSLFLCTLTTLLSLWLAMLRRRTFVQEKRFSRLRLPRYGYVLLGLAVVGAIYCVQYSIDSVIQRPRAGFTQLWMLPAKQTNKGCVISLGVQSFEATSVTYRVTMTINGSLVETWPSISLVPEHEWHLLVPLKAGTTANMYVAVELYRLDKPNVVYRKVSLLLHPLMKSKTG